MTTRAWNWDSTTRNTHLAPIIHNAGVVCGLHGPHSVGGCPVLADVDLGRTLPLLVATLPLLVAD